jgi:DNA replication and repair protein RecF
MQVDRLQLTNFRSYTGLDVDFAPGPQVVVGPNAAGKTNLLEALAMLGTGRSHRAAADAELISWGADFGRVEASLAGIAPATVELVLTRPGVATGAGGGRKRILVNGVPRRAAALADTLPVVLFAPEDMLLVVGGPSLRRQALDGLVAQTVPQAGASMSTYARALTQRNNLLRAIRDGSADRAELSYWDGVVLAEGARIVTWRRATIDELSRPLSEAQAEIAPAEGKLRLDYASNAQPAPAETVSDALRRRLTDTADKEVWNGATLVGPHRDDMTFLLDERELGGFGSRGQQRTAILAFKLAALELLRARSGRPPLLLLDDVFSELDPERRAHLVRRIGALPQAFVTTTTLDDLDPALVAASTAWSVADGRLYPARASRPA